MIALTLIGKPDCHLCDVASDVVDAVVAGLPDALAEDMEITELSILDDPELYEKYWEKIPVLLIEGELHGHWRLSPDRLREALAAKTGDDASIPQDPGHAAAAAGGEER